jgi:hypothetical protein
MVAPPGFEPRSARPEPAMLDHYTTELLARELLVLFFIFSVVRTNYDGLFISMRELT